MHVLVRTVVYSGIKVSALRNEVGWFGSMGTSPWSLPN